MNDHDDDLTSPNLGNSDDETKPGIGGNGTGEAYIAVITSADRAMAAIKTMAGTCPAVGTPGRRRGLECLAHAHGEAGMLHHDTRRILLQIIREEFGEK